MAKDYFGKELKINDKVVYIDYIGTSANFEEAKIEKVMTHQVVVNGRRKSGDKIIKLPL